MKKPAGAGAHGLSKNVVLAVDVDGYAPNASALQARTLSHRYGLSATVAAAIAELAYPQVDSWRAAR